MFMVLSIIITITIYVVFTRPYSSKIDNIRLISHRILLTFVILIQTYVQVITSKRLAS